MKNCKISVMVKKKTRILNSKEEDKRGLIDCGLLIIESWSPYLYARMCTREGIIYGVSLYNSC